MPDTATPSAANQSPPGKRFPGTFTMVDNGAIERIPEVGPVAWCIYTVLARHTNGERRCFPSVRRIARRAGVSESTVRRAVSALHGAGLIEKTSISSDGVSSNHYFLPYIPPQTTTSTSDTPCFDNRECLVDTPSTSARPPGTSDNPTPVTSERLSKPNRSRPINQTRKKAHVQFVPPTLEEVRAYCLERRNSVDPEQWMNHYISNGWKVGRNQMKDWQAAVRTWEKTSKTFNNSIPEETGSASPRPMLH